MSNNALVKKRYAAERRFKAYGLAAIGVTTAFLAFLILDIAIKAMERMLHATRHDDSGTCVCSKSTMTLMWHAVATKQRTLRTAWWPVSLRHCGNRQCKDVSS